MPDFQVSQGEAYANLRAYKVLWQVPNEKWFPIKLCEIKMELLVRHEEEMEVHQMPIRPHTEKILLPNGDLCETGIALPVAVKYIGMSSAGVRAKTRIFSNNFSTCVLCLIKTYSARNTLSSKSGAYFCWLTLLGYTSWLFVHCTFSLQLLFGCDCRSLEHCRALPLLCVSPAGWVPSGAILKASSIWGCTNQGLQKPEYLQYLR